MEYHEEEKNWENVFRKERADEIRKRVDNDTAALIASAVRDAFEFGTEVGKSPIIMEFIERLRVWFGKGREFKSGKWTGPKKRQHWDGEMDFILDRPQCNEGSGYHASFYDSPGPDHVWSWCDLEYFEVSKSIRVAEALKVMEAVQDELESPFYFLWRGFFSGLTFGRELSSEIDEDAFWAIADTLLDLTRGMPESVPMYTLKLADATSNMTWTPFVCAWSKGVLYEIAEKVWGHKPSDEGELFKIVDGKP